MPRLVDDLAGENRARILGAIERAVLGSFSDGARRTGTEERRRAQMAWTIAQRLRYELGWGLSRIADHLPSYLRFELFGQPWEPDRRSCWIPSDGA